MKVKIITTLMDIKTEFCGPLATFDSERDLIRSLQEFVSSNPTSLPAQHPHDFLIMSPGYYDQENGSIQAFEVPKSLGSLYDIIKPKREESPIKSNPKKKLKSVK